MFSDATIFTELRFWALVLCSLLLPAAIFVTLFVQREFSKATVLAFGLLLIVLAGVDIFLLRALALVAQATPSLADDIVFSSELSIALYIFPAAFGTFGLNMVSHVLMHYVKQKEARFEAHQLSLQQPMPVSQARVVVRERVARRGVKGVRRQRVTAREASRQEARAATTPLRPPAGG
jgi:hypothetical protein